MPVGVDDEHAVGVLDVEGLRSVSPPVDVRRVAFWDALVVDAEEPPEAADLGGRPGEKPDVGARAVLERAHARG